MNADPASPSRGVSGDADTKTGGLVFAVVTRSRASSRPGTITPPAHYRERNEEYAMFRPILIGAALITAPVVAQTTPTPPTPTEQRDDAVAAETAPEVAAANRQVGAVASFDNG